MSETVQTKTGLEIGNGIAHAETLAQLREVRDRYSGDPGFGLDQRLRLRQKAVVVGEKLLATVTGRAALREHLPLLVFFGLGIAAKKRWQELPEN